MARMLIQSAAGPENPTRAALALLIARTAAGEGHEVRVFLAGDAVHLANAEAAAATTGLGTGEVAEHLAALKDGGVTIFLSGMSSKARGSRAARASSSPRRRSSSSWPRGRRRR
jgi:uncharacterized protein